MSSRGHSDARSRGAQRLSLLQISYPPTLIDPVARALSPYQWANTQTESLMEDCAGSMKKQQRRWSWVCLQPCIGVICAMGGRRACRSPASSVSTTSFPLGAFLSCVHLPKFIQPFFKQGASHPRWVSGFLNDTAIPVPLPWVRDLRMLSTHIHRSPHGLPITGTVLWFLSVRRQPYFQDLRVLRRHFTDTPMYWQPSLNKVYFPDPQ